MSMTSAGHGGEIVKHAFTVFFGRGIIRLSQFIAFLILARLMTPAEFGWFGIITTAMTVAAMCGSLGLRQSIAYKIGQGKLGPNEALGTAFFMWPVLAVAASGLVFVLYGRNLPQVTTLQAAAIVLVGVSSAILLLMLQGKFLGEGSINYFSITESIPRIALMIFTVALLILGSVNLQAALWAHVCGFVIGIPVAVILAFRNSERWSLRLDEAGSMLRYGIVFAFNLVLITLCSRISMFLIERYMDAAKAGEFYAAVRVYEIFLEVATAFGMVLFSNAARQAEGASIINRNARISCWMFWFFIAMAVFVAVGAPVMVTLMIGEQYALAGSMLQILAIGLAPAAACKVIYPSLAGAGKPGFGSPVIVACLAVTSLLAVVLVPRMGANGGAVAVVVGQYVLFAGYILTCRLRYKVTVRDFLVPRGADLRVIVVATVNRLRSLKRRRH